MSSPLSPERMQRAIDRILATIPLDANRATVAQFLQERRINGRQTSTLLNKMGGGVLRDLGLALDTKPMLDVAILEMLRESRHDFDHRLR